MNIKSITIELELEEKDLKNHGTTLKFENGMWSSNGPIYSRITDMQHLVWKIIRTKLDN